MTQQTVLPGIEPPPEEPPLTPKQKEAYAAPPGAGPKSETCGTCTWCAPKGGWAGGQQAYSMGRRVYKCHRSEHGGDGGPATDIRKKTPACAYWEPTEERAREMAREAACGGEDSGEPMEGPAL